MYPCMYVEVCDIGTDTAPAGVMAVEEAWLPLMTPHFCKVSKPLPLPPPTFDPRTGTVLCHVTGTYGK